MTSIGAQLGMSGAGRVIDLASDDLAPYDDQTLSLLQHDSPRVRALARRAVVLRRAGDAGAGAALAKASEAARQQAGAQLAGDGSACRVIDLASDYDDYDPGSLELDQAAYDIGVELAFEARRTGHPRADELAAQVIELTANPYDVVELSSALEAIELASPGERAGSMDDYGSELEAITMANYEAGQHAIELASQPVPRRAEDRLAHMLAVRSAQSAGGLDFASPASTAGRDLAAHRWQASTGQPGTTTGLPNCGASDDYGHCVERYHAPQCGSSADMDITEALQPVMRAQAQRQAIDAHGHIWTDGDGRRMTMTDHLEALAGQHRPFRDVPVARRVTRFGDFDDPGDQGASPSADTRATAARIARQLGVASQQQVRGAF